MNGEWNSAHDLWVAHYFEDGEDETSKVSLCGLHYDAANLHGAQAKPQCPTCKEALAE